MLISKDSLKKGLFLALVIVILCALPNQGIGDDKTIIKDAILAEADLKNGKSIYDNGRHPGSAHLAFTAGPHWLRSQGGGCGTCHGVKGLGDLQPDFCFVTTPPITYKYLAGDGYPFAARQNGSRPAYNMVTLKRAIETGVRPNGYDMDYCMPRWRLSDKDYRDLLGYLITLDEMK